MNATTGRTGIAQRNRIRRALVEEKGIEAGQTRTLTMTMQSEVSVEIISIHPDGSLYVRPDPRRPAFFVEPKDIDKTDDTPPAR